MLASPVAPFPLRNPAAARLRSGAFTLVELLVVVSIILILLAILIPGLGKAREHARLIACQANLHGLVQAHRAYGGNFYDLKPSIYYAVTKWDFSSPDTKWFNTPIGQGLLVSNSYVAFNQLLCPSGSLFDDRRIDAANWISSINAGSSYEYYWRDPSIIFSTANLRNPVTYHSCDLSGHTAIIMDLNLSIGHQYIGQYAQRQWSAHPAPGKTNIAFSDGSVRCVPDTQVVLKYPAGSFERVLWWADAEKTK